LDEPALSQDLGVDNSEVIVHGLIEYHMVNKLVDLLSNCSDLFNTVDINEFEQLVDLLMAMNLVDQRAKEFNKILVLVINTEEKAVKES
jgi:hypothetical protein